MRTVQAVFIAVVVLFGVGAAVDAAYWLLMRYRRRNTADVLKWTNERRTMLIEAKQRQDTER